MNGRSTAGAAVAGCCVLLALASGASGESPRRDATLPGAGLHAAPLRRSAGSQSSGSRRPQAIAATPCATSYPAYSFTGIANAKEVAGGDEAAVLGGYGNEACDADDGIGGGYENGIGDNGAADWSSIAGGQLNQISGPNAFIGAGESNGISGDDSSIDGGQSNVNSGAEAFIGNGSMNDESGQYGFIGAGDQNTASGLGSFIGAGELDGVSGNGSFIGAGNANESDGYHQFIGSGASNDTTFTANFAAVVSGSDNHAEGNASFIGAGYYGFAVGDGSAIAGGGYAYAQTCNCSNGSIDNIASGTDSFIGAGDQNDVVSNESAIGGGMLNTIASPAPYAAIGGGYGNQIAGIYGTIAGGEYNQATGAFSAVPGGAHDQALGAVSFAAGYQAHATHNGSFVWSDYVSGASPVADTAIDQFVVRASGGAYVYSSETLASGVKLAAGSGTWASLSDRDAKTGVAPLDDASILAKVAALPVTTWRYKTEPGTRHVGPMAQDFYAAFRVGEDDRHITSIDEDGVALAAIKALHRENARLHARLVAVEARDAVTERRLDALERKLRP